MDGIHNLDQIFFFLLFHELHSYNSSFWLCNARHNVNNFTKNTANFDRKYIRKIDTNCLVHKAMRELENWHSWVLSMRYSNCLSHFEEIEYSNTETDNLCSLSIADHHFKCIFIYELNMDKTHDINLNVCNVPNKMTWFSKIVHFNGKDAIKPSLKEFNWQIYTIGFGLWKKRNYGINMWMKIVRKIS